MQLHFWTSPSRNTWYCMKPWVRREGFRWRADFISLSIPFKMKATCSSSVWAQMFGRRPLWVPFQTQSNLWNLQNCGNEKNSSLIQVPRNASCKVIKFAFSARNKFMSVLTDMALLPWKCAVLSSGVPPAALQTSKLSCSEVWVWTLQPLSVPRLFANLHILKYFFKGPKPFLDSSLEDFYHYRNCFELKWRHISSTSTECRTFYSENQTKFLSQFLNIP